MIASVAITISYTDPLNSRKIADTLFIQNNYNLFSKVYPGNIIPIKNSIKNLNRKSVPKSLCHYLLCTRLLQS